MSVIVKAHKELQIIFDAWPFSNEKNVKSYFIIRNTIPDIVLVDEVSKISCENEEIIIKNDCLYFYNVAGFRQAKFNLNSFERKLKVIGTARNYNTIIKLLSMSSAIEKDH